MTRWLLFTLVMLIALHGGPVAAQMACGTYDSVTAKLSDKYGETRRGRGLTSPTVIFEVWALEGGTWTILKTTPNGLTCIMAVGDIWHTDELEPERDPA